MQRTKVTISTEDLQTVTHAAEALGKHITTIYRWYESGKIAGVELDGILFIPTSEVERLKNERNNETKET